MSSESDRKGDRARERFDRLVENLRRAYGLSYAEIMELCEGGIEEERVAVPLEALRDRRLGVLEALVLHLKDERKMRFSQIAKALDRDQRTIWATYRNARRKRRELRKR